MKLLVSVVFCIAVVYVNGQVSTKLDLEDESKEVASPRTSSSNSSKISPKIQGVRVTVDTGNGKKTTETESKESVEIIDTKNTKRVGIHTDITFEISDDKNESNATSSEQAEKDNDASVPIYKGRPTTHRPSHRLPFNPKVHSNYPGGGGPPVYDGVDRVDRDRHHHNHYNNNHNYHNIPVFPRTNDEGIYRSVDRWTNVIPIAHGVWTTERSSYYDSPPRINNGVSFRSYQPQYQQQRQQQQSESPGSEWKPCVCLYDNVDVNSLQLRSSRSAAGSVASPEVIKKSNPFSNRKK